MHSTVFKNKWMILALVLAAILVVVGGIGVSNALANSAAAGTASTSASDTGNAYSSSSDRSLTGIGGNGGGNRGQGQGQGTTASSSGLTQAEIDEILYMREEEKVARDVYLILAELWGDVPFGNIANSEARHMESVLGLIEKYGLTDPADNAPVGEFQNPELQALYDDLIAQGSQSLEAALTVGALIEEVDILDLQDALEIASNQAVVNVFNNLLKGSGSHLKAFSSEWERETGQTYSPQLMDEANFIQTVSAASGQGNGGSGKRQGGGGQGQGNSVSGAGSGGGNGKGNGNRVGR